MPTISETSTVRVAKTVSALGRSMPKATNSASRPFASTEADEEARSRTRARRSPALERSRSEHLAPRWRRSSAASRTRASRWAIVIESVLAITKLPTNSAMPPNASRNFCRKPRKSVVSSASCFRLLRVRFAPACRTAGSAETARGASAASTPGLRRHVDLVELAHLVEELLGGRQVEDRQRRAADRGRRRRACAIPVTRYCLHRAARRRRRSGLPDRVVLLAARSPRRSRSRRAPCGQLPDDECQRVEARSPVRVDAEARGRARRRSRSPCRSARRAGPGRRSRPRPSATSGERADLARAPTPGRTAA